MRWEYNKADLIERYLQEDHRQTWGFVVYRSTYDSDDDWATFLQRLRSEMEKTMDFYGGRDILEKFVLTVFDDRSLFDGASTDSIRRHFQQWSVKAYLTEQASAELDASGHPRNVHIGRSPRYHYAMQVDAEALYSVVHDAGPLPERFGIEWPWVRLIDKSWYLGRSVWRASSNFPLEPIEGVTEPEVGWMKIRLICVIGLYTDLRSPNSWSTNYARPPRVSGVYRK
jgi:hypothetical protein